MTIFLAILLSLLTLGFIAYPLVRPSTAVTVAPRRPSKPSVAAAGDDIDAEIEARVKALRQAPASFCAKCGARLKPDDRFCHQCGQRVN